MIKHFFCKLVLFAYAFLTIYEGSLGAYQILRYNFSKAPLDVVILSTYKDMETLEMCIAGVKEYCANVRRIIVISPERMTDEAEWFEESAYPFTKGDIALALLRGKLEKSKEYMKKPGSRIGWYYQQLLKLYAPFTVPGISPNILVVDSDTIFLQPVEFLSMAGGGMYNYSLEHHQPYFDHAAKLVPGFKRALPKYSGITHHMVFQRCVLEDLFHIVESKHGMPFWKAFCKTVDPQQLDLSGASEYEIYFNFVFTRTAQVRIRALKWKNLDNLLEIFSSRKAGYQYVSCHSFLRKP